MISMPTYNDFKPYLHDKFEIIVESTGSFQVELISLKDHSNEQWQGYSALFQGPTDNIFNQGVHKLKHPKMGEYDLFITPVFIPQKTGMFYQAVFSQMKNIQL